VGECGGFGVEGHGEEGGEDEVVVVVENDGVVADFLKEAPFQVNHVLPLDLHDPGEAINQPLNFLVVVKFVGDDGGDGEHPGALLELDLALGVEAVADEEAEGQVDEEGLRGIVDEADRVEVHLHLRDLDGADGLH